MKLYLKKKMKKAETKYLEARNYIFGEKERSIEEFTAELRENHRKGYISDFDDYYWAGVYETCRILLERRFDAE